MVESIKLSKIVTLANYENDSIETVSLWASMDLSVKIL